MAGSLDTALTNLATTLADVTAFRTWVGAANQAAALLRIHKAILTPPAGERYTVAELQSLRPYALIYSEHYDRQRVSVSGFGEGGIIAVQLVDDVGAAESDATARARMQTLAANIIDGLLGLAGGAGYLNILGIEGSDGGEPGFNHPDDVTGEGKAVWVQLAVSWDG